MDKTSLSFRLQQIDQLYRDSEFDPFDPHSFERAGLEYFHDYLVPRPPTDACEIIIYLPDEVIEADTIERITEANRRYIRRRIHQNNLMLNDLRSEGIRTLIYSLIFCGIVLVIAGLLYTTFDEPAIALLTPVVTVMLWVAIWRPTELLFFDPLPLRRERAMWKRMLSISTHIRPLSQAAPDTVFSNTYT